ncbi:sensor histidine kinase [Ramlibacter sp. PS4R-6]|uniref:sensor histidine kinase n=1 Tax=Ramlibacter sp. PS4R-6 TaxID=3133438 RepID=UPI0030B2E598
MAGFDAPRSTLEELARDSAFARLWRGFMAARSTVALVLLAVLGALHTLAPTLGVSEWLVGLAGTYLLAAVAVHMVSQPRGPGPSFDSQWVSTIGVDLIAFSALQFLQAAGLNYSPLFALPVLMAAVLGSTLLALGTAAGVALLLLADAWVQVLHLAGDAASRFLQAGLTATGYFALAFVVNQLAGRLAREEEAARFGRRAARAQAQVNELVIDVLSEGVIVVDAHGGVQAANPAARMLLGFVEVHDKQPFSLAAQASWQPLTELALRTFNERKPQWAELAIEEESASPRRIHVRTRLTAAEEHPAEGICVMFLQDLREMEARLRTEKLAAMGRMSAAVAHEIRNPLAAIAQANDLMEEDLKEPGLKQLSGLVRKNTQRLQQIVEEILDVSRARQSANAAADMLQLDASVAATCNDWALQSRAAARLQLALAAPDMIVRFDADHLRRVLVNLLDNALRYAGDKPDSIRVATRTLAGQASLHVWSDGAPLEPSVQRHLFEPFFSSESRSSGLGLYICRELCERHGATMVYERATAGSASNAREGNEFMVMFAPGAQPPVAGQPSFDRIAA